MIPIKGVRSHNQGDGWKLTTQNFCFRWSLYVDCDKFTKLVTCIPLGVD